MEAVIEKQNIIKDRSFNFALKIIELARSLKKDNNFEIASQILRSGTSIGANVEEAQAAQSKRDLFLNYQFLQKKPAKLNIGLD